MLRQFAFAAVVVVASACGVSPSPTASSSTNAESSSAPVSAAPSIDPIVAIATGPWRRQPVQGTTDLSEPVEAACRTSEPAIGRLPVALADLRGQSLATLIFADGPS